MAYKVIIERRALNDIDEIYNFYHDTKFIVKFQIKYNNLVTLMELFPLSGEIIPNQLNYRKFLILKRFVVIYAIDGEVVRIARIFDGRTDYDLNSGRTK